MFYHKMGTRQNWGAGKIIYLFGAILLIPGLACRSDAATDKKPEKINISQSRRKSAFPRGTPLGRGRLTAEQTETIPTEIINFHSTRISSRKHPFLFYTKDDINEARKRAAERDCHPFLSFKIGGCTSSKIQGQPEKSLAVPNFDTTAAMKSQKSECLFSVLCLLS